jgi:hypothetical protein
VVAVSTWEDHVRAGRAESASPRLVMPLIVEPKPGRSGKFRLIHDYLHLSKLLDKWPFKIEDLTDFVKQLSLIDKLFSIDIEIAYIHVEVAPRHRTPLGFRFEGTTYVYNVQPFGLTTSASVFCAFTAVTAKAVRDSGLVSTLIVYMDDFGGSVGQDRDTERMNKVLRIVRFFGLVLAPRKLKVYLVCRIKLLGFMLDTETICIGAGLASPS